MIAYLSLIKHILEHGSERQDRTKTGVLGIFGHQMRFDLSQGFPLVTTKKLHFKSIVHELLWFLRGDTNIAYLHEHDVHIWDAWADANGNLGPVYGQQWRAWQGAHGQVDQLHDLMLQLKNDPYSRRHIICSWNVGELPNMALAPCHCLFQFYIDQGRLSCQLYQRSADVFLGVPFNIASYALLTHLIAQQLHLAVGEFIWTGGDVHIYQNHLPQVREQLIREPLTLPQVLIQERPSLFDYVYEDIQLDNYQAHPHIKGHVAI